MCQQAGRWQSSSSNPPWAPEIGISARHSLVSSQNTALGSHKSACTDLVCASPLILLLTGKSHPVYSGAARRSACSAWAYNEDGLYGEGKNLRLSAQTIWQKVPPSLLTRQPQHSDGKGAKPRGELSRAPTRNTPVPSAFPDSLGELQPQPQVRAPLPGEQPDIRDTHLQQLCQRNAPARSRGCQVTAGMESGHGKGTWASCQCPARSESEVPRSQEGQPWGHQGHHRGGFCPTLLCTGAATMQERFKAVRKCPKERHKDGEGSGGATRGVAEGTGFAALMGGHFGTW